MSKGLQNYQNAATFYILTFFIGYLCALRFMHREEKHRWELNGKNEGVMVVGEIGWSTRLPWLIYYANICL